MIKFQVASGDDGFRCVTGRRCDQVIAGIEQDL